MRVCAREEARQIAIAIGQCYVVTIIRRFLSIFISFPFYHAIWMNFSTQTLFGCIGFGPLTHAQHKSKRVKWILCCSIGKAMLVSHDHHRSIEKVREREENENIAWWTRVTTIFDVFCSVSFYSSSITFYNRCKTIRMMKNDICNNLWWFFSHFNENLSSDDKNHVSACNDFLIHFENISE